MASTQVGVNHLLHRGLCASAGNADAKVWMRLHLASTCACFAACCASTPSHPVLLFSLRCSPPGGVKKEFFQLLVTELLCPDYGMLIYQPESRTYWFNPTTLEADAEFLLLGLVRPGWRAACDGVMSAEAGRQLGGWPGWMSCPSFLPSPPYTCYSILPRASPQVLGLAIYNGVLLDFPLPLALYRKILGQDLKLRDLEDMQPTLGRWA